MDFIPIGVLFATTILLIIAAVEGGYRLGLFANRASKQEMESPVSAISAAILGLLAFMLAFTFDIVSDRYDARNELLRQEANAIGTARLRSDFLPDSDRAEAQKLMRRYVDIRLLAAHEMHPEQLKKNMDESIRIQRQLWDMAVVNARKDMNSDVAALYIESLNDLIDIHGLRVAVALQLRIPFGIWITLYILILMGMVGVGYQTAIANSKRTWATAILALAFSVVIVLIAMLDRPVSGYFLVPQQPLIDLRASMD